MITFDLVGVSEYISDNLLALGTIALVVIAVGFFVSLLLWASAQLWLIHIQHEYMHKRKFCLLAIDISPENLQTPKAVEQIFAQLHGALSSPNLKEKWLVGKHQELYSFEIVSIGGYIQFLVRTNVALRDLVEAAVYAQYPDAEITEVADYASDIPSDFPHPTHTLWATEFVVAKDSAYPIRKYTAFEHSGAEDIFKDPMAALLEVLAKLRLGEQAWLQFIITPVNDDWQEKGQKVVDLLAGKPLKESEPGILGKLANLPIQTLGAIGDAVLPAPAAEEGKKSEPAFQWSLMQYLTGGEKSDIEAIEDKLTKIGYRVKFRFGYLAPHAMYSKARGVAPVVGAIKQFNTLNLNAFAPSKLVTTDKPVYGFVASRIARRQKRFVKAFALRSNHRGAGHGFILNIEELASVWHFPMNTVRAPLVKKTDAKRAEPPVELPIETDAMAELMRERRARATATSEGKQ